MVALAVAVSAWMLLPLPALFGKMLLWNLMPPTRLLLLPGLLALFLALRFLPRLELRFSLTRALLLAIGLALAFFLAPRPPGSPDGGFRHQLFESADLLLIPLIFALPLLDALLRRVAGEPWARPAWAGPEAGRQLLPATLVAAAALGNLMVFGIYNPLQPTRPIFEKHDSPQLRALAAMQEAHPKKWLVVGSADRFYGTILNGFGFRSVNHSLLNPQLATFARFPRAAARKARPGVQPLRQHPGQSLPCVRQLASARKPLRAARHRGAGAPRGLPAQNAGRSLPGKTRRKSATAAGFTNLDPRARSAPAGARDQRPDPRALRPGGGWRSTPTRRPTG